MSEQIFSERIDLKDLLGFFEVYENSDDLVIIDLRGRKDFFAGAIPEAVNVDFDELDEEYILENFTKDKTYLFYCEGMARSGIVLEMFKDAEFNKVHYLKYGYKSWVRAMNGEKESDVSNDNHNTCSR